MSTQISYKELFQKIINGNSWWSRLAGSQFVEMLSGFVGQTVGMAEKACRRYLQEAFLSTATKRASILAAAEDRAYLGRKISPSIGQVSIRNKTDKTLSLPQNAILISTAAIQYTLKSAIKLGAGQTAESSISQLVLKVFQSTVTEEEKFLEVILPKAITAIAHKVDVYVNGELWEKRFMFRRTNAKSKVYAEFYRATEQLGIRFGNGINGLIPAEGSEIRLDVWTTQGDSTLIDNQLLEIAGEMAHLKDLIEVKTLEPIVGGAPAETDEETRAGALYTTSFDEQIVWDDDYPHYIKQNIANLVWVKAWGEFEQERQAGFKSTDFINKIYITAFSEKYTQNTLGVLITELLENTKYLNKRYKYIEVIEKPFTITITGKVAGSRDLLQVESLIKDAIRPIYGRFPEKRPDKILEKSVNKLVEELDLFYDFSINWSNFPTTNLLENYIYLDIDKSVFDISYLEL